MAERESQTVEPQPVRAPVPPGGAAALAVAGIAPDAGRVLALQRAVGNAAVVRVLARAPVASAPDPFAPAPSRPADRTVVTDLRYVCFFVGHDLYGTQARRFAKVGLKDHREIAAGSLIQALSAIAADAALRGSTGPVRIDEIVLIAHGHPSGFIKMPLTPGSPGTTAAEIKKLQDSVRAGELSTQLVRARTSVIRLLDQGSSVVVRGCRAGRSQELVDALTLFFGGQATVYVPKEYQGFTRMRIGGPVIKTRVDAFDFLVDKGYIPYEPFGDQEKDAWVRRNLPDGYVPEMFFVAEEEADKLRHATADDPSIQGFKDYASATSPGGPESAILHGREPWGRGHWAPGDADDAYLDALGADQIVAIAGQHLTNLRATERGRPDDWRTIGDEAWWVLRCHNAWLRKPQPQDTAPSNGDPLGGFSLSMPGLAYDTNLLAIEAGHRPDLRVEHTDAFMAETVAVSGEAPVQEAEEFTAGDPDAAAQADGRAATARANAQGTSTPGAGTPGAGARRESDGTIVFPADDPKDVVKPDPAMPDPPRVSLDLDKDAPQPTGPAPVGGSVRPANFKRKIPIAGASGSPDGYFQLRGVEVGLEGYVEWGVKGEREVAVGQLFSYEPGKPYSAGFKADAKLAETKSDSGWYLKWKGGFETTELQDASEKGKWEISTALEWGNDHYVGEVKVFCSYDSIKGELRIGGVKVSPAGIQGDFSLPLTDGTKVTMKGKALISFDVQPNWAKIAERVGLRFAGAAAETAAVGGAGTTFATGLAAIGAGEAVVLGGALVGVGTLLYAYYRSVKDWQDIAAVLPVAQRASSDLRAGFASAFGLPDKGDGPLFAKGAEIGAMMSRSMAERMVKGWEARHPGQTCPFTVDDAEQYSKDEIARNPQLASGLRNYAYGAFHKWVMAEFWRHWRTVHAGETTLEHNDRYARTYLGLPDLDPPPAQPDWGYQAKPEPQTIDADPFAER